MMIRAFFISALLLLTGCTTKPLKWNTNDYTVKSGDTIYSIAWRYEIDPDDLARWNHLGSASLIYAGQRLHTQSITSDSVNTDRNRLYRINHSSSRVKTVVVKQDETLYAIASKHHLTVKQLAQYNHIKKPYLIKPGQRLTLNAKKRSQPVSLQKNRSNKHRIAIKNANTKPINWKWPIKGKLIKTFNKRLNDAKGIDIAGKEGNSIKAAASGKVVYSGNGLISYGNLIIIKHNALYLSAYAHNRKLLVKEGQTVKVGQVIAELGKTGADNPRLHFEIRKNGKPVNPVRYLPRS